MMCQCSPAVAGSFSPTSRLSLHRLAEEEAQRHKWIVSEKAGPRVKVYDPEGNLLAVVADDVFDPGAKNMDLAIDSRGRLYVADTVTLEICVFEPTEVTA